MCISRAALNKGMSKAARTLQSDKAPESARLAIGKEAARCRGRANVRDRVHQVDRSKKLVGALTEIWE